MSEIAVITEQLGKRYRIGARPLAYRTARDAIVERVRRRGGDDAGLFWALRDVSFEIPQGQAIGVIGPNGAGKTTLLKILSRITEPTAGRALVRGRVGSLLEVGTGFHPELSGRENVYLNGAILGMRRSEIGAKFDEIVGFAEVERFIDTPVKRYSSGMYVRLAFAVAAHLEPEILLVDEVLSVGDLAFQRKCLGKMQDQTANEGRTVLFVSHNLGSIKQLTERCLWLESGRLRDFGPTETVFREYVAAHSDSTASGQADLSDLTRHRPRGKQLAHAVSFERVELLDSTGRVSGAHHEGEPVTVRVLLRCNRPFVDPEFEILARLRTLEGVWVLAALGGKRPVEFDEGLYETSFAIDPNALRPGVYQFELYCLTRVAQDLVPIAATLRIEPSARPDDDPRYASPMDLGLIRTDYRWSPFEPVGEPVATAAPAP